MRQIKTLLVLTIIAVAALSGAIANRNPTLAADYSCHNNSNCTGVAQCTGDRYAQTGTCAITCYKEAGQPAGLIVANGSANCAGPSTGGGGGGGGGGGSESGGGYCYDNWFWDSNCGGDPYSLYEPWIN